MMIVYNPTAGHRRAQRLWRVLDILAASGLRIELAETTHRGHASEIARHAAQAGVPLIVAAGGDGTIAEVANGLAGSACRLGVIPLGTANVLARELGLPFAPRAVAAALARGKTLIRDASELRVKETDRIAAVASNLRLMGVTVTEHPDGMEIEGGAKLQGATLPCYGDHRIAMAFLVAGMFAEGTTTMEGTECISTSYPCFERHLDLFLNGDSGARPIPVMSTVPQPLVDKMNRAKS